MTPDSPVAVAAQPAVRLRRWRFLPLDTRPPVIAFVQKPLGQAALLVAFAALLAPLSASWLPITLAAAASALAGPYYRGRIVAIATLAILVMQPHWFPWTAPQLVAAREQLRVPRLRALMLFVVLGISWCAIAWVRRSPDSLLARRPVPVLILLFLALLGMAASGVLNGLPLVLLWAFLATFAPYVWFLCYALSDQRAGDPSTPFVRLGAFHPFWGSSTTPFGKGAAYLRKIEARTPAELAVTQLKGVKLLAWVWILHLLARSLQIIASSLRLPTFDAAFLKHLAGDPYPWYTCWGSVIFTFLHSLLEMAIWSGPIVAAGRLAGYRLLRNTYRPLSSRTLVDFWNRYYFYFKELLVDLFFYPIFLRFFKKHRRLRLFFATFMAAAVGNFIFHFIRDHQSVAEIGLGKTIVGFQSYAFYCAVLSLGIGLSQLRARRGHSRRGWVRGQLLPSAGVMLFYCLMEVFMVTDPPHSLRVRCSFLLHLFGVDGWI
jgi:hypothetical protein